MCRVCPRVCVLFCVRCCVRAVRVYVATCVARCGEGEQKEGAETMRGRAGRRAWALAVGAQRQVDGQCRKSSACQRAVHVQERSMSPPTPRLRLSRWRTLLFPSHPPPSLSAWGVAHAAVGLRRHAHTRGKQWHTHTKAKRERKGMPHAYQSKAMPCPHQSKRMPPHAPARAWVTHA